jgi:protein involved in polysaccharide export with SLBB domain
MGLCRIHLMAARFWFRNGITVADEKCLAGQLDPGKSHEYDWLRMRWISTFAAVWLLLAGCQSNQSEQALSPGKFAAATSAAGYNAADVNATLGTNATARGIVPGTTISITVQEDRTLNRAYVVPANGTIDYPPLGRIALENLTTDEAAQKIREGLEKHYSRKVTVAVAIESALPGGVGGVVYVMGNVSRPGPVVLPRGERYTVIQAIGAAGDFTASANGGKVQLVRYDTMGKKHVAYVNVDEITRGAGLDVEVRDGDWVFVPGK